MRVLHLSPMRFELEYRPQQWIIGLGLVCAVLAIALLKALFDEQIGAAGIAAAMLATILWLWLTRVFLVVRLAADQNAGTLRIATVSVFGETFRERSLADLTGAEVETRFDENDSGAEPGLVLLFGSERQRMSLFKPDPADLLQAADSINTWLAQSASVSVQPGDPRL